METIIQLDKTVFAFLNQTIANPLFDKFFPFITNGEHWVLLYAVLIIWILWKGGRNGRICVLALALTITLSDGINSRLIKPAVNRDRPCNETGMYVRSLVPCGNGKSFASSHSANNFAAAVILSFFFIKMRWVFFSIAALVAFSRVYVGVHYPIDIISGAIIGSLIAYLVLFVLKKVKLVRKSEFLTS